MIQLIAELKEIHDELHSMVESTTDSSINETLDTLEKRVEQVDRASSRVWRRNHANYYYKGFQEPSSRETYLKQGNIPVLNIVSPNPLWTKYSSVKVKGFVENGLDQGNIERATEISIKCETVFAKKRSEVMSCIEIANDQHWSRTLSELLTDIENLQIKSIQEIIRSRRPPPISGTIMDGAWVVYTDEEIPHHIEALARILRIVSTIEVVEKLSDLTQKGVSHLERSIRNPDKTPLTGKKIFIGHGRSLEWLELEKFLKDRLNLEPDQFNRIPTAGMSTKERLEQMLDSSCFAFLVLTAEDEIADDKSTHEHDNTRMQARMNVIHEAGLFQGRLGFDKAIILLENGCEEFSNIHGIGQIRFDRGKIRATFEEIRQHLEKAAIVR